MFGGSVGSPQLGGREPPPFSVWQGGRLAIPVNEKQLVRENS